MLTALILLSRTLYSPKSLNRSLCDKNLDDNIEKKKLTDFKKCCGALGMEGD
jgi:hypothetical protein